MSPVCRDVRISVEASGTTLNRPSFQMSSVGASPSQTKSLSFLRSAGCSTGFFEKNVTQPPSPQLSTRKPFSSRRFSRIGRSFSRAKSSSSYDRNIMGIVKARSDGSTCASPSVLSAAA